RDGVPGSIDRTASGIFAARVTGRGARDEGRVGWIGDIERDDKIVRVRVNEAGVVLDTAEFQKPVLVGESQRRADRDPRQRIHYDVRRVVIVAQAGVIVDRNRAGDQWVGRRGVVHDIYKTRQVECQGFGDGRGEGRGRGEHSTKSQGNKYSYMHLLHSVNLLL